MAGKPNLHRNVLADATTGKEFDSVPRKRWAPFLLDPVGKGDVGETFLETPDLLIISECFRYAGTNYWHKLLATRSTMIGM